MAYGDFKYWTRRTAFDKILCHILLKIQIMMDIKEVLLQWFIHFLIKKTSGGTVKIENICNKELAEELHKLNY